MLIPKKKRPSENMIALFKYLGGAPETTTTYSLLSQSKDMEK